MSTEHNSRPASVDGVGTTAEPWYGGEPLESGDALETAASPEPGEPDPEEDAAPRELESALLSIALFGGLAIFAVGCVLLGWD